MIVFSSDETKRRSDTQLAALWWLPLFWWFVNPCRNFFFQRGHDQYVDREIYDLIVMAVTPEGYYIHRIRRGRGGRQ